MELLDKILEIEGSEFRRFVEANDLKHYPSAYRAFKLGIKNVFLQLAIVDDEDRFFLKDIIDGVTFLEIYKKHLPFFWTLDKLNIHPKIWTLMNMTESALWFLIKSEGGVHLRQIIGEFSKAREIAVERVDWEGRLYYMVVNQDGQREIT